MDDDADDDPDAAVLEVTPAELDEALEKARSIGREQGRREVLSSLRLLASFNESGDKVLKALEGEYGGRLAKGHFEEGEHPRDHGKFSSAGGGAATEDAPAKPDAVGLGGRARQAAAEKLSKTKGGRAVLAMGEGAIRVFHAFEKRLLYAAKKVQAIAVAAKKERGFTDEQTARLGKLLYAADFLGGYATGAGALAMGLPVAAIKASMFMPSASVAYLAYSTAVNPLATWRAAKGVIANTLAKAMGEPLDLESVADLLADAMESAPDPEWFGALFHAALGHAEGDAGRAIAMASAAAKKVQAHPGEPVRKAFDAAKHPRGQPENAGEFGPGGGGNEQSGKEKPKAGVAEPPTTRRKTRTKPEPLPDRFERDAAGGVVVNADVQRWCEGTNEPAVAKEVGGKALPDNEPMDVVLPPPPDTPRHGLELKTMVSNEHRQIRMKSGAKARKRAWRRKNGVPVHTVVIDDTAVYNVNGPGKHDLSKRRVFYRRGFGSFKVDRMHEVEGGFAGLKSLVETPTRKLPPGAWKPKPAETVAKAFDESKVNRGQPENAGEFAAKEGGGAANEDAKTDAPQANTKEGPGAEIRAVAAKMVGASDLPPEHAEEYTRALANVLHAMPAAGREAALSVLSHDYGGAKIVFYPDLESLMKSLRTAGVKIARDEEVAGCVRWRPLVYDRVELHLDGAGAGNTAEGVYAHEFGHLVALAHGQKPAKTFADVTSESSADPVWVKAWKAEIKNGVGEKKLSSYARTDGHEGFAELYRHFHERGVDDARRRWPRCVKFLESKGLL